LMALPNARTRSIARSDVKHASALSFGTNTKCSLMALPNAHSRWMPVVTPANSECRALGPVQTLYESLNRFISLGGNDHTNRRQTGLGREIRVTNRCQYHCGCNMNTSLSRNSTRGNQQINSNG
jgi:hypothetical protein